jgi:hypothetical protein
MEQKSLKQMIQAKADWWREQIRRINGYVIDEYNEAGGNLQFRETKSFPMLREYYGRIYALRALEDILGIEINTRIGDTADL